MKAQLVGEYLAPVSEAVVAAAAAQVHAIVIGPPGYGKSALLRSFVAQCLSPAILLSCDESTPPSRVRGRPHAGALLEGREVTCTDGSLLDPEVEGAVIDEITRASPIVWDALLPVLERSRPVVLATANWLADEDRVRALHDRIALWIWPSVSLTPQIAADIASAELLRVALERERGDGHIARAGAAYTRPEWPEPESLREVWNMTPVMRSVSAVQEAVRGLVEEAAKAGFQVNPRRVAQWARILWGRTCLDRAAAEWDSVSPSAMRALAYAYPASDESEASRWRQVTLRVVDRVGALIEAIFGEVKERLQGVAAAPPAERGPRAMELGRWIAETEEKLRAIPDPRAEEVVRGLNSWYRDAVLGIDPWAK